jgi:hypothetical protein
MNFPAVPVLAEPKHKVKVVGEARQASLNVVAAGKHSFAEATQPAKAAGICWRGFYLSGSRHPAVPISLSHEHTNWRGTDGIIWTGWIWRCSRRRWSGSETGCHPDILGSIQETSKFSRGSGEAQEKVVDGATNSWLNAFNARKDICRSSEPRRSRELSIPKDRAFRANAGVSLRRIGVKRFTETNKWRDPWFQSLPVNSKVLFLYLVDNCNNAGFIEENPRQFCFEIGISEAEYEGASKGLGRGIKGASGWLWIRRYLRHQKIDSLNP